MTAVSNPFEKFQSLKTVPEIYEVFGTKLSFGEDVIAPLAKRLESELSLS